MLLLCNLLLDLLFVWFYKQIKNNTRKIVSVIIWISKLINNGVEEWPAGLVIEFLHHLFKQLHWFFVWYFVSRFSESLVSNKEDYCIDDISVNLSFPVYDFFTWHHFIANDVYNAHFLCPKIVLQIFP